MSTKDQGLCFEAEWSRRWCSPGTESSHPWLAETRSSGAKAPPEPPHITATVPGVLDGRKQNRAKQRNHQAGSSEVWVCLATRRHLLQAQLLGLHPASKVIHHPHATSFWKSGCNLNSDLFAWPGHRLQPRYPLFCQEDPLSPHRSPGWHNPALLPTRSLNSSRKRPQQATWPPADTVSDQPLLSKSGEHTFSERSPQTMLVGKYEEKAGRKWSLTANMWKTWWSSTST